jgi:hypothetical protein
VRFLSKIVSLMMAKKKLSIWKVPFFKTTQRNSDQLWNPSTGWVRKSRCEVNYSSPRNTDIYLKLFLVWTPT